MGPIEFTFGVIVLIVVLIGVARGYRRELGSTLIILAALFLITFLGDRLSNVFNILWGALLGGETPRAINAFLALSFQILFLVAVFAGYAGRTLDFPGREARPPLGFLLSVLLGLINGYLIAGTLWYYMNLYDYPYGGFDPNTMTPVARDLISLLPQTLFPSPVWWIFPVAVLLILRVWG